MNALEQEMALRDGIDRLESRLLREEALLRSDAARWRAVRKWLVSDDPPRNLLEANPMTEEAVDAAVDKAMRARSEDAGTDVGVSKIADGCTVWPCNHEPLVRTAIGWRCSKCGGDY